ncbi:hypothetical protein RUM44_008163 [Polyplax serrata]|uniref:Uncharacterized protein n=1 Tax=Polyplax serrata TaxID=468196 RepID=A0ABR1B7S9_POLSC
MIRPHNRRLQVLVFIFLKVDRIPKRIQKLYEKVRKPLLNATNNEVVDARALETLPVSFLYLIPKVRLSSMTGFAASEIVRRFPFDDALTMKILSLLTDKLNIESFLNGLADKEQTLLVNDDEINEDTIREIAPISPAVEKEIAHALSRWFPRGSQWEYWLYKASMITGTPVLASLPNYFLNSLSLEMTEKFLFHLRNWRWDNWKLYDPTWDQHSRSVKRIWGSIVLNKTEPPNKWSPKILKQFGFFLTGASPDELSQLSTDLRISHDFKVLLDMNWNALQARAVFDVGFSTRTELGESALNSVKKLIMYLLPRQIQQFTYNATNFGHMKLNAGISIPTGKQLLSSYVAHLISKNKTKVITQEFWREHMSSTGKFFYLMPASFLEDFENESLDLAVLAKIDSASLSFRQARYLTNSGKTIILSKPETVVQFKGLIKSVPSVKVVELRPNLISNRVKEHLLMFASAESLPFMAAILEKIRGDLVDTSYLEKLLFSKDFRQYFNLLGNRDITQKYKDISLNLFEVVNRNPVLERNVRLLPATTLSALLSVHRKEALMRDGGWNYENLVESPLRLYISGLTCRDIEVLETSDFMPVIGYYVHQRRAMNEVFPKNMQYCSQKALTQYFKLKATLRGFHNEPLGLLSLLELHEVRAVGGYILAGLPISAIDTLSIKYNVISEIGKLSIPELLTATSMGNVKELTEIYVAHLDVLNLQIMNGLGNLVWFLNADKIPKLDVKDFKLYVESMEETAVKGLCLNEKERNAWKHLIIRTFGKPDSWSPGTLSYLGDLLFVFDSYELERVNKTSRTEAADVLSKSTSFHTTLEWPGKRVPIYLYEACLEILKIPEKISYRTSLKQLFRFYLESNQYLIETVSSAQAILKINQEPNLVESAPTQASPIISTHVTGHMPVAIKMGPDRGMENEDYDYSEEEMSGENFADENLEGTNSKNEGRVKIVQSHFSDSVTEEVTTVGLQMEEEHSEIDTPGSGDSLPELVMNKHKRFVNFIESKSDSTIFHSKNSKSFEELREELQRNASRALIVEVPLNRTDFLHFGTSTAHHIKISCDAIRMLEKSSSFILTVQDFENMDNTELEDCVEYLGTLNLDSSARSYIWRRLKKWKESGNLMEVGSLVSAIEDIEITEIPLKLSQPWALENLNVLSTHITDPEMMPFITDQFLSQNKDLEALQYESAMAMGRLICAVPLSHQRKYLLSHPEVFINVAKNLGRSLDCNSRILETCIRQLANIATSKEAFGETHKWDANDVADLGVIVAGLKKSDWQLQDGRGLRAEAFAGLTPSAVACIPPDVFKVLTDDQLQSIPTLSATAVSSEQSSSLSASQYEIIDRVRRQIPPADLTTSYTNGASKPLQMCRQVYLGVPPGEIPVQVRYPGTNPDDVQTYSLD